MNTDQVQAEWLASRIADRVDALIWPTLTYGHYPAFVAYAGSGSLSVAVFEAAVREIVEGLLRGRQGRARSARGAAAPRRAPADSGRRLAGPRAPGDPGLSPAGLRLAGSHDLGGGPPSGSRARRRATRRRPWRSACGGKGTRSAMPPSAPSSAGSCRSWSAPRALGPVRRAASRSGTGGGRARSRRPADAPARGRAAGGSGVVAHRGVRFDDTTPLVGIRRAIIAPHPEAAPAGGRR